MDKQPIYVKFNSYRKPEFRLRTEMRPEGEKIFVYKVAENKKSEIFLKNISKTYGELENFNTKIKLNLPSVVEEKTIKFEYISGITLLENFEIAAKQNSYKKCMEIYKKLEQVIDMFPSEEATLSSDFKKIFGEGKEKAYTVIKLGVLDINLDNIIIDKGNVLHLIDYEWSFDFGIPKRYILYRAIYYSYSYLGSIIANFVKMEDVEKEFNFTETEIKEYLRWEKNFQEYVSGVKIDSSEMITNRKSQTDNRMIHNTMVIDRREYEDKIEMYENKIIAIEGDINAWRMRLEQFEAFKKGRIWRSLEVYRVIKKKLISYYQKLWRNTGRN